MSTTLRKFKIHFISIFLAVISGLIFSNCKENESTLEPPQAPNIIIIVADDLGYSDVGAYGGEINTPHLNGMADRGVLIPNFYNAGMCVISRSSLLTGQWWPRVGFGIEKGQNLAQELKKHQYHTGVIGKWHLQGEPNDKGFDYFFGFLGGYSSYFKGSPDYRLNKKVYKDFDDFYSTDAFSSKAVEFIENSTENKEKPFFLYLSYQAPHNPLQASKEDILKYRGQYLNGWQATREARIKNQIEKGLIDDSTPLPNYPENLPEWESLTNEQKDLEDLRMSVYAAMVQKMDDGIGKVMDALKRRNIDDNTLVLFLSDNGTDSFSVMDKVMLNQGLLPGDVGSNYQPGTGWAYTSVAPNRLYKISQHNGGVKTGAIAQWPNGINTEVKIVNERLHVADIMPTILDIVESSPDLRKHENLTQYAGTSFSELLKGKEWSRDGAMFFQFMDNRAIRTDKYNLVEVDGQGWELYDQQKDPLETNDISNQNPNIVKQLETSWLKWWVKESGKAVYEPESVANSPHYSPQGDRGSGKLYEPSAMPDSLANRYPKFK